ncbi:MAG: hypothetical protein RL670_299 [Actinomycetota bacterium]
MIQLAHFIERLIFWSRWLLAPLYVGLIGVLLILIYKFGVEFVATISHVAVGADHSFILDLLSLLDLVLLANLILIVLFSGYENFVSRIEAAEKSVDRPYWMGTVDFSGLKIKLIGSLVAISVIELLRDFVMLAEHEQEEVGQGLIWRVLIHLTFVVSGVLFAVMDWISDSRALRAKEQHGPSAGSVKKKS